MPYRLFLLCLFLAATAHAQELPDKQRSLAGRYAQLEHILLRLAETSTHSNPRQATLLRQVLAESKDKLLVHRFETLVLSLERRQLGDALNSQAEIEQDLLLLLRLLENVNRDESREREKEAVQEFLKDLEEILHGERSLMHQTRQQDEQNLPRLENIQRDIRIETQALQERIAEYEGTQEPSSAQQAMQQALDRMQQAEQQLQQAQRDAALEDQEEAVARLQRVKEELEKILRQLREEELMQTLEKLEARFKRMLQQEQAIRAQTDRLIDEAPDERQAKIRADRLAIEQQSVIDDAESALLILREDGTAQAMVESLLQARFDMLDVKSRLEQTKLDAVTLHIVDAVIESLQEMLDAVQNAIAESRERQENQDNEGNPQGQSGEEPLIQLIAELRMIRSMQRRVNERTARYDLEIQRAIEDSDIDLSPFRRAVEELARQQNRISRILHELRIGRIE
ncbi:MAG: hypothetical protein FWG73_01440 [Planctomycetaceae bacterium]|nr:hypothetical protein [Planctomycetaceae bacterium]